MYKCNVVLLIVKINKEVMDFKGQFDVFTLLKDKLKIITLSIRDHLKLMGVGPPENNKGKKFITK